MAHFSFHGMVAFRLVKGTRVPLRSNEVAIKGTRVPLRSNEVAIKGTKVLLREMR